jgi:hypothetical protein
MMLFEKELVIINKSDLPPENTSKVFERPGGRA